MNWDTFFKVQEQRSYYQELLYKVKEEYHTTLCYPPLDQLFYAFDSTPFESIKVVIVGQDPYHGEGQAHGLAFSVKCEKIPPSLRNIFRLVKQEGYFDHSSGDLTCWSEQGVFLLNRVFSVRANKAGSHRKLGWEVFSNEVIQLLSKEKEHLVFILWGSDAQSVKGWIDERHTIIESVHPSGLSAYKGFFDSHCFSRCNKALKEHKQKEIIW